MSKQRKNDRCKGCPYRAWASSLALRNGHRPAFQPVPFMVETCLAPCRTSAQAKVRFLRHQCPFRRESDEDFVSGQRPRRAERPRTSSKRIFAARSPDPSVVVVRIVLRRATVGLTGRILLWGSSQPLRMNQQGQFDLLVLALSSFINAVSQSAMRADHAPLRSSTENGCSSGAT